MTDKEYSAQEWARQCGENDEPEENACGNPHNGGEDEESCMECMAIKLNI